MGEIMIIDTIENIEKYAASFPQLRAVAAVLRSGKAETAAAGSYATDDASVRYSVSEYQTRTKGTKGYETHRHAADVQFIVSGEEIIDVCENAGMKARSEYDVESDIQFFDGELANGTVSIHGYCIPLSDAAQFSLPDGPCLVGIRPEAIFLAAEGSEAQHCEIKSAVYMGNHWEVIASWAGKDLLVNCKPEDFNANLKQAYVNLSEQGIFLLKKE